MPKSAIQEPGLLESMRDDFEEMRRLWRVIREAEMRIEAYRDIIREAKRRKEDAISQLGAMLAPDDDEASDAPSVRLKEG